jgi:tetratricopeptide (TPR) repeat protein
MHFRFFALMILLSTPAGGFAADKTDRKKRPTPSTESNRKGGDNKNVNELFREARKFYDAEKYGEATVAFNRIIKKYPTHQPSLLLYARSLYKLEKSNEAYYLFSRVNPQLLDPDAAYEYGQIFYAKQQYGPALMAFQKIPENHAFADLARYYGGVCAVKLKQYEVAEDMMSKALVLPEKEARSRSLYLKHIARLRELRQKQSLAAERVQERARLKSELDAAEKSAPTAPASAAPGATSPAEPAKPAAPVEYAHKGFESVTKRVELGALSAVQTLQKNQFSEERVELRQIFLQLHGGTMLPISPRPNQSSAALGLQIFGKGYESATDGGEFIKTRDTDKSPVVDNVTPIADKTTIGEFNLSLWGEIPLQNDYWLSLTGSFYVEAPKLERKDRTGNRSGVLKIGQLKEKYSILGTGSITEGFNSATDVELTTFHADLSMSYKINEEFSTDITAAYENFGYQVTSIDGADSIIAGVLGVTHTMPLNFSFNLKTDFEYLGNFLYHQKNDETGAIREIDANGQRIKVLAKLSLSPFPWMKASVYGKSHQTTWTVNNPEDERTFKINNYDYLAEYGVNASINLFF